MFQSSDFGRERKHSMGFGFGSGIHQGGNVPQSPALDYSPMMSYQ